MKNVFILMILTVILAVNSSICFSAWIVNTGEPTGGPEHWPGDPNWLLPGFHELSYDSDGDVCWYAGRFTLDQNYIVDSMEGYMCEECLMGWGDESDQIRFSIYEGADYPDPYGTRFFETTFYAQPSMGWVGTSDLNLKIDAGTYWLAFEPIAEDTFTFFAGIIYDVLNPLDKYATFYSDFDDEYEPLYEVDPKLGFNFGWGVRIGGTVYNPQSVPEPNSIILLIIGVSAMALKHHFKPQHLA